MEINKFGIPNTAARQAGQEQCSNRYLHQGVRYFSWLWNCLKLLCSFFYQQFALSCIVWPQLGRKGKKRSDFKLPVQSLKAASLGINFLMFTSLAGRRAYWVINWSHINLIGKNKTTLGTIPITELAHVTKAQQVVHYLVQDSIIFIDIV